MEVRSQTVSPSTAPQAKTETKKENSDFILFLKLMTAQAKNQDPLNPTDTTDYATQLATFTQVEQQIKADTLLEKMVSTATLGAASLIGKNARMEEKGYFAGTSIRLSVNLDRAATRATLIVVNADGKEVATQKLDLTSKTIEWSGKGTDGETLETGVYGFSVESFKGDKSLGKKYAEAYSEIVEIAFTDAKTTLTLAGGQTVLLDKIKGRRAD